jgi:glycosyltransferase involved in cell wall biosynthesis
VLRGHYKLPAGTRFRIIPAPVEHIHTEPKRCVSTPLRLVTVGRVVESKNLLWMLRALSRVKSSQWQWTIAGNGPQRIELQRESQKLGIEHRVTFLGHCQNIASVYETADLHLFPSRRESLGLVILEAMGFGVPTIAFSSDGDTFQTASDEVIVHGVDGYLAPDEASFIQRVQEQLKDPARLIETGEAGRQKVLANHSWDKVASAWGDLLRDCANSFPSARLPEVAHA